MQDRWNAFLPYSETPLANAAEGPLAGLRLAVKDLFDVAGYSTAAGNPMLLAASGIKTCTAPLVQQLVDAGARFVGKTTTDELAYSLIGNNIHFGMPINPAYPNLIPGGSSSGSAVAVVAGLADIGLGTDTSGSIRLPAAVNGVIGWRPTHGLLDMAGSRPLAPSFDVAGIIVNSLATIGRVMDALAVPHPPKRSSAIIMTDDILAACDQSIVTQFLTAIEEHGMPLRSVSKLSTFSLDDLASAFTTILQSEAWHTNRPLYEQHGQSIAPDIAERLVSGSRIGKHEVMAARDVRRRFQSDLQYLLKDDAILAMPTLPVAPPVRDANPATLQKFRSRSISILCLAGLSGCPQISMPIAHNDSEPIALSLLGAEGQDRNLLKKTVSFP